MDPVHFITIKQDMFCFKSMIITTFYTELYSKTGLGSCVKIICPRHVLIVGPGWQLLNIIHGSKFIYETLLYDGMWCLLTNEWCSNQGSGYFYLPLLLLPIFCWRYESHCHYHCVVDLQKISLKQTNDFIVLFVFWVLLWVMCLRPQMCITFYIH